MRKINLVLIGAGNVVRTRHLPALLKNKRLFNITGIVDTDSQSAISLAKKFNIPHSAQVHNAKDLSNYPWFSEAEAVIIGIPPQHHYSMVKECLLLGKHVIVEKPFTLSTEEAKDLVEIAKKKNLVLVVKHNFQFTRSFLKLENIINAQGLGKVRSIYCVQLTNQSRRIPPWTEELPLGLFYDESPHYFYLVRKFTKGDTITIKNVFQSKSETRASTPLVINLNLECNHIPVTIYWNFDSPICEWYFTIFGDQKSATVDLFRDILIVLPNDSPHLGPQVMKTSILTTFQHWKGIVVNGFSYIQNKLYYGFDILQKNFYKAIVENNYEHTTGISAEDGLFVTQIQNDIVNAIKAHDRQS